MLAELEQALGRPIYELVDFVGGTSTGAIIAAGIGLHMSAQEILEQVYHDLLPNALGRQDLTFWFRFITSGLRHFYPLDRIVDAMGPLAAGKMVRDLQHPAVLMTVKDLNTSNTYFVVSRGPGAAQFGDWPVTGAVAASGVAPIYFPPVLDRLVDGGVGVYGNPSLATAIEAMEYIGAEMGFTDDNVIHISFGTGYVPNHHAPDEVRRWWLKNWIEYIIGENIEDAAMQQMFTTRAIYGNRTDFRRYNPLLTAENIGDVLGVPLNGLDPRHLSLDSTDPAQIDLMEAIGRAYARKIDWRAAATMPWDTTGGHAPPAIQSVDWAGSIFNV